MAIDFHTHLGFHALYPDAFLEGLVGSRSSVERASALAAARVWLRDEHGTRLLREMDDAGVSTAVVLMIDGGVRFGEAPQDLERSYELHRRIQERHAGRVVMFGGVDPRRGRWGLELFRRSIEEWGFGGMKLYPPMGFSVLDPGLEPFLDICAAHRLPVLTHYGPSLPELDATLAGAADVAALARRRPEIVFVMAHGGYALGDAEVLRALEAPNVVVDVAGFQAQAARVGWDATARDLRRIFEADFNERVVFGSDYPLFHFATSVTQDLARIRSVFEALGPADETPLRNVLTRNAERLLAGLLVAARG